MTKPLLEKAERQRQIAEHRLAEARATLEVKALESTQRLMESPVPMLPPGNLVPWHEWPAFDEFNQWPAGGANRFYWQTNVDDRTGAKYLPLYETELDLRRMRAEARKLLSLFPVAKGAVNSLASYVVGTGYEFTAQEKHENSGAAQLVAKVQQVIDEILEYNDFSGLDREIHVESRIDGEAFVGLYEEDDHVRIELIDPDFVAEPAKPGPLECHLRTNGKLNYWHHGVHTLYNRQMKRDDVMRPLGYHCVFDRLGDDWDYMPAHRCEHIKRNVNRRGRRGVSDFHIVLEDFKREGKIRRNTAEGAAILAAIALIVKHPPGATKTTIENIRMDNATARYNRYGPTATPRLRDVEQLGPGTVKDLPDGAEAMVGPLGELRSPVYIEVCQYLLRIIGMNWNCPEYLISGDASNANYASTLVSGAPFVKAREDDQAFDAKHFLRLIWKALRLRHAAGAFGGILWRQIRAAVDVKCDYQGVATDNRLERAQENQILHEAKVLSKRTWATDAGLDYDEEQKAMEKEPKEPKPVNPLMGMGGPPGQEPGADPVRNMALASRAIESLIWEDHGDNP